MCDCVKHMNARLAERNSRLVVTLFTERPLLQTEKVETRKRGAPTAALPSYCPFCGVKYPPVDAGAMP